MALPDAKPSGSAYIIMPKYIVDIETVGCDFEELDEASREYLLKYAENDEDKTEVKDSLSFFPLTAQIVAIGMLDAEKDNGFIYFQDPSKQLKPTKEKDIEFIPQTESGIIKEFWSKMRDCSQIITFNGRGFDCPFIMIRSAINKIRPTKNLMPYRYDYKFHTDLLDQLSFYGSVRRKFNLHMWCKAFGIKSPKEDGITGYQVKDLFKQGKYLQIAQYCTGDLYATKELYTYWERFIKF